MDPSWPSRPNCQFSRSNEPQSSYEVSLASRPKRPIFKVKQTPEQVNLPFCHFSCAIVHEFFDLSDGVSWSSQPKRSIFKVKRSPEQGFFGDPKFRPQFGQKFSLTFVKALAMESVVPHSQNCPFSRSNDPRSSYGSSCPSRQERPIFKDKQSPEQSMNFLVIRNFDLIFAKKIYGRPLRP
ncbi:hypothetical protein H5410_054499 [Solanum commersonii]|uniref:Uncharacterized protein n=1 Tax=Solanum commersonii TaxID=4109 RepID=A0A9J5WFX5_SOLCO|nr:hypothetical protein H5410_054499 [Solanum commersonii]